ncbi:MAG TPA: hypothetical protein VJS41_11760 [Stellaceae bacterium]|nr:hypothetical protein [Stellaceae bacterium]
MSRLTAADTDAAAGACTGIAADAATTRRAAADLALRVHAAACVSGQSRIAARVAFQASIAVCIAGQARIARGIAVHAGLSAGGCTNATAAGTDTDTGIDADTAAALGETWRHRYGTVAWRKIRREENRSQCGRTGNREFGHGMIRRHDRVASIVVAGKFPDGKSEIVVNVAGQSDSEKSGA